MESESASPTLHSLRVAVLGDSEVGKKTYIQKLAKKQNQHISSPNSLELCKNQISFQLQSNFGPCQVTLVFFDINLEEFSTNQQYTQQVLAKLNTCSNALLMFSLLSRQTYKNIPYYYRAWMMANQNGRSVLIPTKIDVQKNIKIKQRMITFHRKKNLGFQNISTKAAYNLLEPFLYFFRKNLNNQGFTFIDPQKSVDLSPQTEIPHKQEIEKQVKQMSTWLPLDDEDL